MKDPLPWWTLNGKLEPTGTQKSDCADTGVSSTCPGLQVQNYPALNANSNYQGPTAGGNEVIVTPHPDIVRFKGATVALSGTTLEVDCSSILGDILIETDKKFTRSQAMCLSKAATTR